LPRGWEYVAPFHVMSKTASIAHGPESPFSSQSNFSKMSEVSGAPPRRVKQEIVPQSFFSRLRTSLSPTKLPPRAPTPPIHQPMTPPVSGGADGRGGADAAQEAAARGRPITPPLPILTMQQMQQLSPLSPRQLAQQHHAQHQRQQRASSVSSDGLGEALPPPVQTPPTGLLARLIGGILPAPTPDIEAAPPIVKPRVWRGASGPPASQCVRDVVDAWTVVATVTGASKMGSQGAMTAPFMAYALLVEVQLGGAHSGTVSFAISRRWSRFVELHRQLVKDLPGVALPPFPPSPPFHSSVDPSVVSTRIVQLQKYLAALFATPVVCRSEAMYSFLELNSAAQIIVSAK